MHACGSSGHSLRVGITQRASVCSHGAGVQQPQRHSLPHAIAAHCHAARLNRHRPVWVENLYVPPIQVARNRNALLIIYATALADPCIARSGWVICTNLSQHN